MEGLFSKVCKDGQLQGKRTAAEKVGISKGQGDRCHNYLKMEGLVKVRENKTFANIPKDEILDHIRKEVQS